MCPVYVSWSSSQLDKHNSWLSEQMTGQPCLLCLANSGHYVQTFQRSTFIPAMVIGIIGVYQFIALSVTTAYLSGVLSDSGFMPVVEYLLVWCPV